MSTHVSRKGTTFAQWKALEDLFSSSANLEILDLRIQLQTLQNDGVSVNDYIIKARTISHHLAAIGEIVSNKDIVMYALLGFSTNNPFVTSINMMHEKPSFSVFHNQLVIYEHMLDQ